MFQLSFSKIENIENSGHLIFKTDIFDIYFWSGIPVFLNPRIPVCDPQSDDSLHFILNNKKFIPTKNMLVENPSADV